MNVFVRLLFYIFTLLLAFFSGPFFLLPWYSISGPYRQYMMTPTNHNNHHHSLSNLIIICQGSPLPDSTTISFLSSTTVPNLNNKNLSIVSLLWTHSLLHDNSQCPHGFQFIDHNSSSSSGSSSGDHHHHHSTMWSNDHHNRVNEWVRELDPNATVFIQDNALNCFQWRLETVYYLSFTPSDWEEQVDYYGPRESSQHVAQLNFDLQSVPRDFPVFMQAFLLDFGVPSTTRKNDDDDDNTDSSSSERESGGKEYSQIVKSQKCQQNESRTVCQDFFRALMNESKPSENRISSSADSSDDEFCNLRDSFALSAADSKNRSLQATDERQSYTDIQYEQQRGFCIANDQCAAMVRISNRRCGGYFNLNKHPMECQFILHYMVLPSLPKAYSISHIWTYNVIAFITCLMAWLFTAFFITMSLHHSYLLYYYIKPPVSRLEAGSPYDIQLTVYGEPFSSFAGVFEIREHNEADITVNFDKVLFKTPLTIDFGSEEYEGSHQAVVSKEYTFSLEQTAIHAIHFSCQWKGEFEQADFNAPNIQVIMRKHFPPAIKSWSNAFGIAPLICLFQLLFNIPDRKLFIRFEVYIFLSVFVVAVTSSWVLVVLFTILMNIPSLESLVFSTVSYKTKVPLVFYCLFLISELLPALITIIKPRRFASKFFSIDNAATVEDSKAFMISQYHSSVAASTPRVSHMNVDYVPLETVSPREHSVSAVSTEQLAENPVVITSSLSAHDIGQDTSPYSPSHNPLLTPSLFFSEEENNP